MNTFTEVWNKMDADKGITESGKKITMTPEQFKKMLQQFYDVGHKHGEKVGKDEGIRTAKELENIMKSNGGTDYGKMFSDIFPVDGSDGGLFGGGGKK